MLREFFYFPKSDRKAMLFMLIVGVAALLLVYGLGGSEETAGEATAAQPATLDGKAKAQRTGADTYYYNVEGGREGQLFAFDPNTADSTSLLRLGLSPRLVRNIYKYRAAGGVFRKPTDFARLYGLTAGQYRRLEPYISIAGDFRPASEVYAMSPAMLHADSTVRPAKLRMGEKVALNAADTTQLKLVPGIGSYFANQIVGYRERLGGYVDVSQLREIEGFPDSALPYFSTGNAAIRKINVNRLTLNQLKRHPYINFFQAREIVDYRRLRGSLSSMEELRLLKDFAPSDIERLSPYVEF